MEAKQRVEVLEMANTELRDSLLYSFKPRTLQAKITDLNSLVVITFAYMALRQAKKDPQC